MMNTTRIAALFAAVVLSGAASAAGLDTDSVTYKLPADIKLEKNAAGTNEQVVLFGDPSKPGPYVVRLKWLKGNMSRPHFHPNDRHIVVLAGTWWVGTGETFDPASTVPMPAGTYVLHKGKGIHYDGAKDEDTVIQIWGIGPAASTPAEKK
jgi:hypothetical protein